MSAASAVNFEPSGDSSVNAAAADGDLRCRPCSADVIGRLKLRQERHRLGHHASHVSSVQGTSTVLSSPVRRTVIADFKAAARQVPGVKWVCSKFQDRRSRA